VGVTTISLSDRQMEVWYPVELGDIGTGPRDEYFIRDYVSESVDALIPPEVNPPFVTDATRGVPASGDGPFPLVLFSHGFASYRVQSTYLTTHLASWGFVVISPDYLERGLRSVLGEPPPSNRADTDVADEAIEAARAANAAPGGPLEGRIDGSTVYPIGHSAGGGTTLRLLSRPDVTTGIPMAAGLGPTQLMDYAKLLPAGKAVTWIGAPRDSIAAIANVRNGYTYTSGRDRQGRRHPHPREPARTRQRRVQGAAVQGVRRGVARGPPLRDRRAALPVGTRHRARRPGRPGRGLVRRRPALQAQPVTETPDTGATPAAP
jgi:dienelactone hydrolase